MEDIKDDEEEEDQGNGKESVGLMMIQTFRVCYMRAWIWQKHYFTSLIYTNKRFLKPMIHERERS